MLPNWSARFPTPGHSLERRAVKQQGGLGVETKGSSPAARTPLQAADDLLAAVPLRSGVPGSEPQSPLKAWTRWVSRCREGARFWLISRMAFFLAAYVVVLVGDNITGKGNVPPHTFLSSWVVWDGVYYLHIAQFG